MRSTTQSNNRHRFFKTSVGSLVFSLLILAAVLFINLNRQYVLDTVHFWSYQPTSEIKQIAARAMLSSNGTFMLYATRPEIDSSQTFNSKCDRKEVGTAILGCYVDDRTYVYDVTDARLDGIKEVTAAHEMLHAVYVRMSDSDRKRIDSLVEAEYKKLASDPDFSDRMAFYARTEPGERDNELHSIIGTEVANISPELEAHYAKYFTHRNKLLDLYNNYNSAFLQLEKQSKQLAAQLDTLSKDINAKVKAYNSDIKDLNADILEFNQRARSGGFSSQYEFNSERSALQQRVSAINATRTSINNEVARYEALRAQYNDIVTQSQNLYKSIDSTLAPTPSI